MNATNLMIVSHPDDELLWGWRELMKDPENWLIIVVSSSFGYPGAENEKKERVSKFNRVIKLINCDGIFLGYPDNPYNLSWDYSVQDSIKQDIEKYVKNLNLKMVVTHNTVGEYGHYHHKIISKICLDLFPPDVLNFFDFDLNLDSPFPDFFDECFRIYFKGQIHDPSVIGHKKLSAFSKCTPAHKYIPKNNFLNLFYNEDFLNCRLNTFNKFL